MLDLPSVVLAQEIKQHRSIIALGVQFRENIISRQRKLLTEYYPHRRQQGGNGMIIQTSIRQEGLDRPDRPDRLDPTGPIGIKEEVPFLNTRNYSIERG